jgi:hypothetical protein
VSLTGGLGLAMLREAVGAESYSDVVKVTVALARLERAEAISAEGMARVMDVLAQELVDEWQARKLVMNDCG